MFPYRSDMRNLVLSGGGVKGIAFIGAVQALEEYGIKSLNLGGVSAGSIISSLVAAGYSPNEMRKLLEGFNFEKVKDIDVLKRIPVVAKMASLKLRNSLLCSEDIRFLLEGVSIQRYSGDVTRGFFSTIKKIASEGCLYNGDYIEEWVAKVLLDKGIRTFADLRWSLKDENNPKGYRVRMTAVDLCRGKILTLPDDLNYYGIDPDKFSVAAAVRMSTSVPLVFKSVNFDYIKDGISKKASIVDGGVIDNYPVWLCKAYSARIVGFELVSKKKFFSLGTPFGILQAIIHSIHETGVPDKKDAIEHYNVKIDTSDVSFLDFSLNEQEKDYLYNAGYNASKNSFQF